MPRSADLDHPQYFLDTCFASQYAAATVNLNPGIVASRHLQHFLLAGAGVDKLAQLLVYLDQFIDTSTPTIPGVVTAFTTLGAEYRDPAGDNAIGYKAGTFHGAGSGYAVHDDIIKHVYNGDHKAAWQNSFGQVLYNRSLVNSMYMVEAVRTAQAIHGKKPLTGEQIRDGLENLDITAARLKELGMEGYVRPLKISCLDHESGGPVMIQQWDGKQWNMVSDWIEPMTDVIRPMVEKAAAAYAKENNITPRTCS